MEQVFVLDKQQLDTLLAANATPAEIMSRGFFTERAAAETNFALKQVIPYVYITQGDKYLVTERLKGGTENRLHNQWSLGAGGHINPCDDDGQGGDMLHANICRELSEELGITDLSHLSYQYVINLANNEVEQVHVGLTYHLALSQPQEVTSKEPHKLHVFWATKAELAVNYHKLEGWSKELYERSIRSVL